MDFLDDKCCMDKNICRISQLFLMVWRWMYKNLKSSIVLYVLIIISMQLDFFSNFINKYFGYYGSLVRTWISDNLILKLLTFVLMTLCWRFLFVWIKESKFSLWRVISFVFLSYWIFCMPLWEPICLFHISYSFLISLSLLFFVIYELFKLVKRSRIYDSFSVNEKQTQFVFNTKSNDYVETYWNDYAIDMISMIPVDKLKEDSIAIGISGEWGSGKTTFLSHVTKVLKTDFIVVEFNPWVYSTSRQIIDGFFNSLVDVFSGNERLITLIDEYKEVLNDVGVEGFAQRIINYILPTPRSKDMSELKDYIEKCLVEETQRPIAVIIDDLDRLDTDEIFEVLRLIRITANFRNIVYIAAFDRNYVSSLLDKKINSGEHYLEKIFNVEVTLPRVDVNSKYKMMRNELESTNVFSNKALSILEKEIANLFGSPNLMNKYLPTFRDIKRFVNIFTLDCKRISGNFLSEYSLRDFFWIELLHYSVPDVYNQLKNNPREILEKKTNNAGVSYYICPKDRKPKEDLLELLFVDNLLKMDRNSICYINNYYKYFNFRVPSNVVSLVEFNSYIINGEKAMKLKLREWSKKSSLRNSLLVHLKLANIERMRDNVIKENYVCAIISVVKFFENTDDLLPVFRKLTRENMPFEECGEWVVKYIKTEIDSFGADIRWNKILSSILPCYNLDEWRDYEESYLDNVITFSIAKSLMEYNFQKYVEDKSYPLVETISDGSTPFYSFICSFCYRDTVCYSANGEIYTYSNIITPKLIELYTDSHSKEFEKFISHDLDIHDPDENGYYMDYDEQKEYINEKINKLFNQKSDYRDFIEKCFDVSPEIIDGYFNRIS